MVEDNSKQAEVAEQVVDGDNVWMVRPELIVVPGVVGVSVPETVIRGKTSRTLANVSRVGGWEARDAGIEFADRVAGVSDGRYALGAAHSAGPGGRDIVELVSGQSQSSWLEGRAAKRDCI